MSEAHAHYLKPLPPSLRRSTHLKRTAFSSLTLCAGRWDASPPPSRSLPVLFGFINSCSLLHCRRVKWNGRLAGTHTSPWVTCRSTGSPSSTPWSWCSFCQVWLIFIFILTWSTFRLQWHLSKCLSAGILSMIIIRTLRKDIANYNREDDIVRCCILICRLPSDIHLLYNVTSVLSLFFFFFPVVNRRIQWRNLVGRTSMVMCSAHLSIPWYLAPCWDLASSSSAWFSLLSVSIMY